MNRALLFILLMGVAGCSLEQQNGDLRVHPAALFADQRWAVTSQAVTPHRDRACTVSAGEINVTQRAHNDMIMTQVETSHPAEPGSQYAIIVGSHRYESIDNIFDAAQSQKIIRDFTAADTVYTEWREFMVAEGVHWRWFNNTIPLAGFDREYQICTRYVLASGSR